LNLEPWFIPLFSGTFRASGLNQKRVVQTRNFRSGPLFCGPDQIKWFRPGKTGIFKLLKKPVPPGSDHFSWFKPGKPGPSLFFSGCQAGHAAGGPRADPSVCGLAAWSVVNSDQPVRGCT
jgi:hypothetical protein